MQYTLLYVLAVMCRRLVGISRGDGAPSTACRYDFEAVRGVLTLINTALPAVLAVLRAPPPAGQSVPRSQNVLGVTFSYQPPPKSIVPCAASLKELYAPPHSIAK
jgi:hypothetical protein